MTAPPPARVRFSAAVAALILLLAQPRAARAENDLLYRYEDYRESGGRIAVQSEGVQVDQDIGTDMHLMVGGVIDTIAGATPTGEPAPVGSDQVVLSHLTDRRHAWNANFSRQFPRINVELGFARSIEHDYMSNGWSINTLTDFNQKNTTLLVGFAGTDDNVEVFFKPAWLRKVSNQGIVGVTQLLDPLTSVTLNLTWGRETGFLNDQYKLVEKGIQILPGVILPETFAENRPNQRNKGDVFLSLDRNFPSLHGTFEASYRLYHDTYGITANTGELSWFQRLGEKFILRPNLRLYEQDAANFYYYRLDGTSLIPTHTPDTRGPDYSSDARLSALDAYDYGLKAIWTPVDWLQLTASVEEYGQRGRDGITPQSAYYRALRTAVSAKISW